MESPSIYCRSNLGDKISDYEDLWTPDTSNGFGSNVTTPLDRGGPVMSSFRPDMGKKPDLIQDSRKSKQTQVLQYVSPMDISFILEKTITATRTTLVQQQIAIIEKQTNTTNSVKHTQLSSDSLVSHLISPQDGSHRFGIYHKNSGPSFTNPSTPAVENVSPNPIMQPRNRFGMILTQQSGQIDEVHLQNLSAVTPSSQKDGSNKQGSPFYAVPADALSNANIVKRPPKNVSVPLTQRFSEPPKGPLVALRNIRGMGDENILEKSHLSGSLDELKRRNRQARGRMDPWPLDSSWEFMAKENENEEDDENEDYDSDLNWKVQAKEKKYGDVKVIHIRNGIPIIDAVPKKPLTVNQIIAKKLPELKVLELVPKVEDSSRNGTLRCKRTSAYDNLDRSNSVGYGFAGSSVRPDGSVASDDGTVFSEPWDSSRWDTLLNSTDELSDTINFSRCKPACLSGDDDTMVEDSSLVVLRNKPPIPSDGKVATIGRSRSIRDREVLSE